MTTQTQQARFWNPDLMRCFYEAENHGMLLKAAGSSREAREQGGLYAVYRSEWDIGVRALKASDSLAEVQRFLRSR